jgi:hypothetical protein
MQFEKYLQSPSRAAVIRSTWRLADAVTTSTVKWCIATTKIKRKGMKAQLEKYLQSPFRTTVIRSTGWLTDAITISTVKW